MVNLRIHVRDSDTGEDLENVQVNLAEPYTETFYTDSIGTVNIDLEEHSSYLAEIGKDGYEADVLEGQVRDRDELEDVYLDPQESLEEYGTINFIEENSLEGVLIEVADKELTTDENGEVSLTLEAGKEYGFEAQKEGFGSYTGGFFLGDEDKTIEFELEELHAITFIENNGLEGVEISIEPSEPEEPPQEPFGRVVKRSPGKVIVTDSNGEVTVNLESTDYLFTAKKEGYVDFEDTIKVEGEDKTVEFELEELSKLTFIETNGLQGVSVAAEGYESGYEDTETDSNGEAVLYLEDDSYFFVAEKEGYAYQLEFVEIEGEDKTIEKEMREYSFAGGDGSPANPYIVQEPHHLKSIDITASSHFIQSCDIDLEGTNIAPIGLIYEKAFKGTYDGQGYKIKNYTFEVPPTAVNIMPGFGFFMVIAGGGKVKSLTLENVYLKGPGAAPLAWILGPEKGEPSGECVEECHATGKVEAPIAAGLVIVNNSKLVNCSTEVEVIAIEPEGGGGENLAGGLAGANTPNGIVSNCYAAGEVSADAGDEIAAGLVALNQGIIENSYFDTETTGQNDGVIEGESTGVTGLTSEEMKKQESFENWDFEKIWDIGEGETKPYLRHETEEIEDNIEEMKQVAVAAIKPKRGPRRALSSYLQEAPSEITDGELIATIDTNELFIGNKDGSAKKISDITMGESFPDLPFTGSVHIDSGRRVWIYRAGEGWGQINPEDIIDDEDTSDSRTYSSKKIQELLEIDSDYTDQDYFEIRDISPDEIKVISYDIRGGPDVSIPPGVTIEGQEYVVKMIFEEAFRGTGVSSIVVPDTVEKIMTYAFADNPDLSKVSLPSGLSSTGPWTESEELLDAYEKNNGKAGTYVPKEPGNPQGEWVLAPEPDETAKWGNIEGDIAEQEDLKEELDRKADNVEELTLSCSQKDEEGIFTLIEWKREDGTLYKASELEGESPEYSNRTVKYYDEDGEVVLKELVYELSYDEDGDLIEEALQEVIE